MEELKEFKKELEEILEKVNAKLEEDNNKVYWTIDDGGDVIKDTNDSYLLDRFRKEIGNYFKTKKEAEEYLEDLKVKAEIKNIAKELNKGKEIDWDNEDQEKYSLNYNNIHRNINIVNFSNKQEGATYCLDKNFKEECIDRIGKERLKNYLKRN